MRFCLPANVPEFSLTLFFFFFVVVLLGHDCPWFWFQFAQTVLTHTHNQPFSITLKWIIIVKKKTTTTTAARLSKPIVWMVCTDCRKGSASYYSFFFSLARCRRRLLLVLFVQTLSTEGHEHLHLNCLVACLFACVCASSHGQRKSWVDIEVRRGKSLSRPKTETKDWWSKWGKVVKLF